MAVGALIVCYFFDPEKTYLSLPCLFNKMTGILCPGCGITRGIHHLVHGKLLYSMQCNALLFFFPPWLFFLLKFPQEKKWLLITGFMLIALYTALRNCESAVFAILRP